MTRASRAGVLALLAVLLAALLAPARAGENLTPDEEKWVRALVQQLGANSPRVRRGAETALAQMGLDALPLLVDASADVKGAAREGLKRVLIGLGLPAVRAALEHLKAEGRGERQKQAGVLLTELGGAVAAGTELRVPLRTDALQELDVLPLGVLRPVTDRLPWPRERPPAARPAGPALELDLDGDGQHETRLEAGSSRVVEAGPPGGRHAVAVLWRGGRWLAAPAGVLKGDLKGKPVEVLDGDQDGLFGGERDYVRWAGGAFGLQRSPRRVLVEDAIAAYEVRRAGEAWEVVLLPAARPEGAPDDAWRGLVAVNRLRQSLGVGPALLDLQKSAACRQHCEWLRQNAGKATEGLNAHRETPGTPGYTAEGAAAGMNSILAPTSDPVDAVRMFFPTLLHRGDLLGEAVGGFGVGSSAGGRGGWTAIWGANPTVRADGAPLVVPAPGQVDVSVRGLGEDPPPDDPPGWYARPHGFPVAAVLAGGPYAKPSLALYEADGVTPVPGRLWTPEKPVSGRNPDNDGAAFFMPDQPLAGKALYVVDLTAEESGRPVRWTWTFRTR